MKKNEACVADEPAYTAVFFSNIWQFFILCNWIQTFLLLSFSVKGVNTRYLFTVHRVHCIHELSVDKTEHFACVHEHCPNWLWNSIQNYFQHRLCLSASVVCVQDYCVHLLLLITAKLTSCLLNYLLMHHDLLFVDKHFCSASASLFMWH